MDTAIGTLNVAAALSIIVANMYAVATLLRRSRTRLVRLVDRRRRRSVLAAYSVPLAVIVMYVVCPWLGARSGPPGSVVPIVIVVTGLLPLLASLRASRVEPVQDDEL